MKRTTLLLLALAALLAAGYGVPAPAPGAVVGMNVDLTWGIPRGDMDREVRFLQAAGVRWVRMNMPWSGVEPYGRGRYDARFVRQMDAAVGKARAAGLQVLMPIVDGVPYWASADPARRIVAGRATWNRYYRPRRYSDYGRFAGWVARRYARMGVHAFEVWNEPNLSRFWPSGPSAREYVAMLRAGTPAVRHADPSATVLLGGLYQNGDSFLDQVYRRGGRGLFDVVGDHAYPDGDPAGCRRVDRDRWARGSLCGVSNVRRVMVAHGDGSKPIWLTELGWTTARPGGVSPEQQAEYLHRALVRLGAEFPWVRQAFVYNLRDDYWLHDDPSSYEANYGMLRTDFTPKPAYVAVAAGARGSMSARLLASVSGLLAQATLAA